MKTITKTRMMTALIAVGLAACAARHTVPVTPAQQGQAVTIVLGGGTVADVAAELGLSTRDARWVVRSTARELMRWLPSSYEVTKSAERTWPEASDARPPGASHAQPVVAPARTRAIAAR